MTVPSNVGEALRMAAQRLRAAGSRSPRLDAELLLAAALEMSRAELFRLPERELTAAEAELFDSHLRRREAREPVAYIRGRRAFRTLDLEVTPDVLIPRPETETLVEVALEALACVRIAGEGCDASTGGAGGAGGSAAPYEPLALDVGTGSGCVALALAAENPFVRVVATDVDPGALMVAANNAIRLGLQRRVGFLESDYLSAFPARPLFDVIVSNPPYIPDREYAELEPNVRDYEPRLALHGGEDGLDAYRLLVPQSADRLRPGGVLAVEVGAGQAGAVAELFAATASFEPAELRTDLGGITRVVWATLSGSAAGDGARGEDG